MREYCPLCEKNGLRTRIKCFQINWDEAVFMCSSVECPWPVEKEDLLIIQRPIAVYKTVAAMEEAANKYFKKEEAPSPGFMSTYTPPRTPDVVAAPVTGQQAPQPQPQPQPQTCTVTVPIATDPIWEPIDDDAFFTSQINTILSKPCDIGVDSSVSLVKPEAQCPRPQVEIRKVKRLSSPAKVSVFKGSAGLPSKANVQLDSKSRDGKVVCTTVVDSSVVVKNKPCDTRLSLNVRPKRKLISKNNKLKKTEPLKKFDFEEFKKEKESTKVESTKEGSYVVKKEINVKTELKLDSADNSVQAVELAGGRETDPTTNPSDDFDLDFDQFFGSSDSSAVQHYDLPKPEFANQSDIDSILTSLSKDSGIDHDPMDMADLEDFLQEDRTEALKDIQNTDYDWSFN